MINVMAASASAQFTPMVILIIILGIIFYGLGVFIGGMIQYALSGLKSKVPGMVLPILNGISSIFGLLLMILGISGSGIKATIMGLLFLAACILNVIIFSTIYKKRRASMTNTSELEKMTVQDLD